MPKVSIIGAGNVGATAVYYIAEKNLADIVMVDVVEGLPQAKALDYLHAAPMRNYQVHILGTNDYQDIKRSRKRDSPSSGSWAWPESWMPQDSGILSRKNSTCGPGMSWPWS
jgi:GrpB-like predicted nucleotidyltransferase (UPF0157 family)